MYRKANQILLRLDAAHQATKPLDAVLGRLRYRVPVADHVQRTIPEILTSERPWAGVHDAALRSFEL